MIANFCSVPSAPAL
jgi:hypothetical protein